MGDQFPGVMPPGSPRRIRPMADWFEIAPSALTVLHGGKDRQMRRILAVVCAVLTAAGVDAARESAGTADTTALARRFEVEDFVEHIRCLTRGYASHLHSPKVQWQSMTTCGTLNALTK